MTTEDNYIYVYLDPTIKGDYQYTSDVVNLQFPNEPYYVGKGRNMRYIFHISESKFIAKTEKHKRILGIIAAGFNPRDYIIKVYTGLSDDYAYFLEHHIIELIGRNLIGKGPLTNYAPGGKGSKYGHVAKLSNENMVEVEKLYLSGISMEKIAPMFNVSTSTIKSYLLKCGTKLRPNVAVDKLNAEQYKQVCALYSQGITPQEISAQFNVNAVTIRNVLIRCNITLRSKISRDTESTEQIVARYLSGESSASIAKDFGITRNTVVNLVKRLGYARRSKGIP